ncbi:hypothetical protein DEM27_31960 [Metarhizobium album]|uniref:Antifreeze protein n=1 Tax=Metarhizobium album TaxID=2182425 RepID=A0A2U2DG66_9HYPH|nr:hypothetical protein [Rhizobium album]PWE52264.1 hypothetical protein DEM27_31960 [Rhizobium album]
MFKLLSTCGLAAIISIGAFVVPAGQSLAQDIELQIGPDGLQPRIRDRDREDDFSRDRRRGCNPEYARSLARDAGLRRAEIVRVTERRIVIEGMTRAGPERMTFANRRGCPEI